MESDGLCEALPPSEPALSPRAAAPLPPHAAEPPASKEPLPELSSDESRPATPPAALAPESPPADDSPESPLVEPTSRPLVAAEVPPAAPALPPPPPLPPRPVATPRATPAPRSERAAAPRVTKTAVTDLEELELYKQILASAAAKKGASAAAGAASSPNARRQRARRALREGAYFILAEGDGEEIVCDARGRELGTALDVLGPDFVGNASTTRHAAIELDATAAQGIAPFASAARQRESTRMPLTAALERRRSQPSEPINASQRLAPGRRPAAPAAGIKPTRSAGVARGVGRAAGLAAKTGKAPSRPAARISRAQMQANWDALG